MSIKDWLFTIFFLLTIPVVMAYYIWTLHKYDYYWNDWYEGKSELIRKIGVCGLEDEYY